MFKNALLLALTISSLALSTADASEFSLKGLDTGQNISDIKQNQHKLKCSTWARDTNSTNCITYYPEDRYKSLADQQVLSVSFIHDSDGTIHSVSFYLPCSSSYQLLDNSLQHKFGKPTKSTATSNIWQRSNASLTLLSQGGEDGVCYIVTNSDSTIGKILSASKQEPKTPGFSKDL